MDVPIGLSSAVFTAAVVVAGVVMTAVARAGRPGVAAAVGAWLAVDVALAAAGVFAADPGTLVPVIALGIAGPIALGAWLLTRTGPVADVAGRLPLPWLIGVQLYRAVGVVFLAGWAMGRLPAAFAVPAGLGDVAVGLAAPFVARRLLHDPAGARPLAVAWNVAGIADLVVAVTLGFLTSPSQFQQLAASEPNTLITRLPFVLVPVFAVPLSVLLHVIALRRLRATAPASAAGQPGDAGRVVGAPGATRC
jgi:hypothetical protein